MCASYRRPKIMGIINATDDSFFAESRALSAKALLQKAEQLIDAGADIIDIGAESTRPGSSYVDAALERKRVLRAIDAVQSIDPSMPISVDTRKYSVAKAALDAGAEIINDVSGLRDDDKLASLVAERGVQVCIMHMRGTPKTMQVEPHYDDVIREIKSELQILIAVALDAGVRREQIIIDPGIGFGKRYEDNWRILHHVNSFTELGYPVLIGLSRKSFLRVVSGEMSEPEDRLFPTLAAQLWCAWQCVCIVRTHDVLPFATMLQTMEEITQAP